MTKKDFELIASILKKHKLFKMYQESPATYHLAVEMFASALQDKNPRFNKDKFLQACGVEIEQKCACDGCNNVAEQYYKKEKYCDGHYCMIHSTM